MSFFKDSAEDMDIADSYDRLVNNLDNFDIDSMVNTLDDEPVGKALLVNEHNEDEKFKDEQGHDIDESVIEEYSDMLNILDGKPEKSKESERLTFITKGTTVGGPIHAGGSLEINGDVNGDVDCKGRLTIHGSVKGNVTASEVLVNTPRFEGKINCSGAVRISVGSVVIGDVTGSSAVIAGAVKGELDITGSVILESTAVVKGNVKGKSIQVSNGAVLQGLCSLAYSEVDIDNIFNEEEK